MKGASLRRGNFDDDAFEQRAEAGMRAALSVEMPGICKDDEASRDPFGAFEQRQGVADNVVPVFSRE